MIKVWDHSKIGGHTATFCHIRHILPPRARPVKSKKSSKNRSTGWESSQITLKPSLIDQKYKFQYRSVVIKTPPLNVFFLRIQPIVWESVLTFTKNLRIWGPPKHPILDHFLTVSPLVSAKRLKIFSPAADQISRIRINIYKKSQNLWPIRINVGGGFQ